MRWIIFFSNFDGRISRKTFWLTSIALVATQFVVALLAVFLAVEFSLNDWIIEVLVLTFIYPKFVIDVKRGHDRNISLWIIGAVYAMAIARELLIHFGWLQRLPGQSAFSPAAIVSFAVTILVGIVSIALLIELGFRRGTPGSNRYGPDPLALASSPLRT
jgi:uncharacterized membrane protein YhaH (DUF805 family)